jgi:hypothetical protein
VSANNGAIQIMTVAAGSSTIRRQTLAGSVGGPENVSQELKSLRLRFGKLIESDGGDTRMGFGTEDEIVALRERKLVASLGWKKGDNVEMMRLKRNAPEPVDCSGTSND